ncbi:probable LRR receptor-like serine/threonine-protein kinase At1g05700 [Prosopis cineraria]|uniref:probable LRR receptor-like serine/threonine-protein kinase At1g05700 n=1 Tax=Prosopis cineraria TaxID=364024 RepID=UPI00240F825D|nr:probable LRR receptor-like serine/threonine-protein kinase At1g05700 [Prosopis cineraria]
MNNSLCVSVVLFLFASHSVQVLAEAGNSEGISIDCGVTQASWDENNFYYEADDGNVVESGKVHNVSSKYMLNDTQEQAWKQLNTLRSFPEGKRNCYILKPIQGKGNNYLVRAYYMYGNYDLNNSVPSFQFQLGVNFWTDTDLDSTEIGFIERMEIIHVSSTDNIYVCLINTGNGAPFISLLEVWPLTNSIYRTTSNSLPLDLMARFNLGMSEGDSSFIRYPDDIYGRSWLNPQIENSERINASETIHSDETDYKLPNEVLSTAIQSQKGYSSLFIDLSDYDAEYEYYVYLHFFDFLEHPQNQLRKMDIAFNTDRLSVTLKYQELQTIRWIIPKGLGLNNISITSSPGSSLPPMINALEIFRVLLQPNAPTHERDGK